MSMTAKQYLGLSAQGLHSLRYYQWGDPAQQETLICVHGLTRNSRDFDHLATALMDHYRVLCPDVVGRGESDWLADKNGYQYSQYLNDMVTLLARANVGTVDWVGTSMGGLIGLMLAAQQGSPIRKLVINDVGPFIPKAALERIASYVGKAPEFPDMAAVETYLRQVAASFGPLTDAQWQHLAIHSAHPHGNGYRLAYDPGIATAFENALEDVNLWPLWQRVQCPVLVLRGAESDLLSAETAAKMARRGPPTTLVEFDGVGHAPALMDSAQIATIRHWLLG